MLVDDCDKAIEFYNSHSIFLIEDTVLSDTKRWVIVGPEESACSLLLAKAAIGEQRSRVGNQTGGRVFPFLFTDNFERDYNTMQIKGIE